MIRRNLARTAALVGGRPAGVFADSLEINGVSTDSRSIRPGNLFVPLNISAKFDGHDFVLQAFEKGASAALWQHDRVKPAEVEGLPLIEVDDTIAALQRLARSYLAELPARVIGITGSNGKTTTKDMVASVLASGFRVHKTAGNLNSHIGLPLTILQIDESIDLLVLEMGMRGRGEIDLLARIAQPDVAVITIIGESHLELLGSREEIARAKTEVLNGLKTDGLFVYPGEEPLLPKVLQEMPKPSGMKSVRFGLSSNNDIFATLIEKGGRSTSFRINNDDAPEFTIPVLGEHNVANALSAIAVGRHFGLSYDRIAQGLASVELTGMRIDLVQGAGGVMILNDAYNASPTSTSASIKVLEGLQGYKRKIAVLGDMLELGEREADFHREIGGGLDPKAIDFVLTYGRLGRHIAERAAGAFADNRVRAYDDKAALIADLRSLAGEGDLVLIKGSRGMRLEEVVQALVQTEQREPQSGKGEGA